MLYNRSIIQRVFTILIKFMIILPLIYFNIDNILIIINSDYSLLSILTSSTPLIKLKPKIGITNSKPIYMYYSLKYLEQ